MAESRLLPSAIPTRFDSPKAPKTKLGKSSKKLQNINSDSNLVARPAKAKRGYVTEHSMPANTGTNKRKRRRTCADLDKVSANYGLHEGVPTATKEKYASGSEIRFKVMEPSGSASSKPSRPYRRTQSSYCAAANCNNSRSKRPDLSFFRFPNQVESAKRWAINLRREDLIHRTPEYLHKNCTVCSEHFESVLFLNDLKNRLHSHAIPTKVNVSNPPKLVTVSRPPNRRKLSSTNDVHGPPVKRRKISNDEKETGVLQHDPVSVQRSEHTCTIMDTATEHTNNTEIGSTTACSTVTTDGVHKMNQTPSCLTSKSPRKTLLRKKIHSLQVLNLRSKRIGGFKCRYCKLIFTSRQEVDAHRQNDHKSQKRPIGAKNVECPDRQVLIKVSSDVKSLNAPVTKKVQEYSQLQLRDNCSGLNCLECRLPFGDAAHLRKYIICKLCRYATNCINAYQDHVRSYHTGAQKMKRARERPMGHDLHCACGFKSQFGDNVARHLVQCCKRTSYLMAYTRFLETEGGKPTPHILSMLGLIKQSGKKSPSEKSSGSHKWKRVKINDVSTPSKVSVFLGSCDSESNLDEQSLVPSSPSGVSDHSATVRSPAESVTIHTCDPSVSATPMDDNVNQDLNDGSNYSHKPARVSPSSTAEILSHKTCDSI